jgi:hypothetical protein
MSRKYLVLISAALSLFGSDLLGAETVINIKDFDAACGKPQHNCHDAFQKAFAAAAKAGGGTVQLEAGTFYVDFPGLANDNQPGKALDAGSLLSVPPRVIVRGHTDGAGNSDSIIEWKITSIPVFVFAGASGSGMSNLHLRFTGTTPQSFPYGDVAMLRALGYKPTFQQANQMSGGNYEMFSFAFVFDSEHCVFENLLFDSATHDNQHVLGFGLNAKGKGVNVASGSGGLNGNADGNRFSSIKFYDYVMGMLVSGQENLVIENVVGDRRGSTAKIAPGHIVYFTGTSGFGANGRGLTTLSRNVRVTSISEGPQTYSNAVSLGTLSIKFVNGGTFEHIHSQHPMGLIQSIVSSENLTFNDLVWSSDSAVCDQPESIQSCGVPVIESVMSKPEDPPTGNLKFSDIHLKSTRESITTNITGKGIVIDGLTIETPPMFRKTNYQQAPYGVLGLKNASDVTIRNFIYTPILTSLDSGAKYNQPLVCWGECANVKADVDIKWPAGIAQPGKGHPAITSGIQFDKPGTTNSISSRIDTR